MQNYPELEEKLVKIQNNMRSIFYSNQIYVILMVAFRDHGSVEGGPRVVVQSMWMRGRRPPMSSVMLETKEDNVSYVGLG
ncbi:hypothetical protein RIF29_21996 [Crotalaria pallida]|uniref:Uncharacterized protein n=1 Tax=Crotalaria pallida TaxID=3830 RepID=A0AAN9I8Z5_CROPI